MTSLLNMVEISSPLCRPAGLEVGPTSTKFFYKEAQLALYMVKFTAITHLENNDIPNCSATIYGLFFCSCVCHSNVDSTVGQHSQTLWGITRIPCYLQRKNSSTTLKAWTLEANFKWGIPLINARLDESVCPSAH